ncbi:MAG: ABC transporter substrate-binding protein [Trueperaceae bacterium]|nr:MAG: ABC transporter substrate-binding protein [Trueperaceae bacterium]
MKRIGLSIIVLALIGSLATAQVQLKAFVGSRQNPDLLNQLVEPFEAETGIDVVFEVGGNTSEVQQQYLNTVLQSKSSELDLIIIDVVRPAQYAAAGWAEPLNAYFESDAELQALLEEFLPGPVEADYIDGTLWAMPAYTDAQFLYYRKDLLEQYGFDPPTTWSEMISQAQAIMEGEGDPNLQGFNYQGAAIEGANCTFLEPLWTAGGDWRDADGNVTVDSPEGRRAFEFLLNTMDIGVTKPNIAETATDDSRKEFQAGDVIFMLNWGYVWARANNDADSQVVGKVGVAPLPAFEGFDSATCIGGWQWVISAFSDNKDEAFQLIRFLTSEDVLTVQAAQDGRIPARYSIYQNPEVLEAAPHYGQFFDVIVNARSRPVTPFYDEVSQLIRTTVNAVLARSMSIDEALETMQFGLEDIVGN